MSSPAEDVRGGLARPAVTEADAVALALELYGISVSARELGSNQDRNFVLEDPDGSRSVLRVDNPVFGDDGRDAQHAALEAYRAAGVPVPTVLPGLDGGLTQRSATGHAVRLSAFVQGAPMVDIGYLAPVVIEEFGTLAASSVRALATLDHPGLERTHMWIMQVAAAEVERLAASIADDELRRRVLDAALEAQSVLEEVADVLPVQAIHGDLTDDNVLGTRGDDGRVHPQVVIDLGDLAYGWRVSELAVTVSSLLHHEPDRPLRVLDAIEAFHRQLPLTDAEMRALWPLVVLRGAILVASGWRQLEIDGDNDYARERLAGERAIFDAATALPLREAGEHVRARLEREASAFGADARSAADDAGDDDAPLRALLPAVVGPVEVIDLGVESSDLHAGRWLDAGIEDDLVAEAFDRGAAAAVFPYGIPRLTRTQIDAADAATTWPLATEVHIRAGESSIVASPLSGTITHAAVDVVVVDRGDGWSLRIEGLHADCEVGHTIGKGARLGAVPESESTRPLVIVFARSEVLGSAAGPFHTSSHRNRRRSPMVQPERAAAWSRLTRDPGSLIALPSTTVGDAPEVEQDRRGRLLASAQERYYDRPMQVQRGWRHHLVDTTGRAYVDLVNNVTALGHGHPAIADVADHQLRTLTTNSRFLYRELAEYSERLLSLVPAGSDLDTVILVNSGSEAVDLAVRRARAATGRQTVVTLREAYHGWTMASDAITTSAYDNPLALASRPEWVHVADVPNRFRGTYRGDADDMSVGARYAADLGEDLALLSRDGRDVAGFICEPVLGNAGGVLLPDGYLADVYARVRGAGGLCIADEVQVGFGRTGSTFWAFERAGVVPDIITIAKPMGNGFPIGGVITSRTTAEALAQEGQFFSSTGGNPLSCRIGMAVLDVMEAEGLQENARVVGERFASGLHELADRHALIGPVHGDGLYLGVELVRDHITMEPAAAEAAAICERLRELGVIVQTTSERSNVLKIKPPLCLTPESADFAVAALDRVLTEGW